MKPSQAALAVKFLYSKNRPGFLWGAPGIGKSDLMRQVAADLKIGIVDKRLSQSDPTEMKGFPFPNAKTRLMEFFHDGGLPTDGEGILFLDELPNAPPMVANAAYQLILDRRLGDYELPSGWVPFAAGNKASHRSNTYSLSKALAGRFQHIDVTPDVDDWIDWAIKNNVSPQTRGYVRFRTDALYTEDFSKVELAYPSPRAWVKADEIVQDRTLSPAVRAELLVGTIGPGTATEFLGYCENEADLPDIKDVLADPGKVPVPERPSTKHAVISFLEGETKLKTFDKIMAYVERFPIEFQAVYVSSTTRRDETLCTTAAYTKWLTKHASTLAGR